MREVEFRGKNLVSGKWLYGSLIATVFKAEKPVYYEIQPYDECATIFYNVRQDSIGQSTGLLDKNGNTIYEGDLVKLTDTQNRTLLTKVEYLAGGFWYIILRNGLSIALWEYNNCINKSAEIIGNIIDNHDNPELLSYR